MSVATVDMAAAATVLAQVCFWMPERATTLDTTAGDERKARPNRANDMRERGRRVLVLIAWLATRKNMQRHAADP